MRTATVIFYPTEDKFECLFQVNNEQCLELLTPFFNQCRKANRFSHNIAEINFKDGLHLWFASDAGTLDANRNMPVFGNSRYWLRIIPAPKRTKRNFQVSDDAITEFIREAYEDR